MRKILISVLAAGLLLVGAGAATGSVGGIVGSAGGYYGFAGTAAGSNFDVRPFSFYVLKFADGSVKGRYDYRQVRDGVELTVRGSLTCATFRGNQLWVGGVIEESSRATLIGLDMWFQVQDNKGWRGGPPDMSSTIGAGGPGTAKKYCDDAPVVLFPFFIDAGFISVWDLE